MRASKLPAVEAYFASRPHSLPILINESTAKEIGVGLGTFHRATKQLLKLGRLTKNAVGFTYNPNGSEMEVKWKSNGSEMEVKQPIDDRTQRNGSEMEVASTSISNGSQMEVANNNVQCNKKHSTHNVPNEINKEVIASSTLATSTSISNPFADLEATFNEAKPLPAYQRLTTNVLGKKKEIEYHDLPRDPVTGFRIIKMKRTQCPAVDARIDEEAFLRKIKVVRE